VGFYPGQKIPFSVQNIIELYSVPGTANLCNQALGQESKYLIRYPGSAPGYKNIICLFFNSVIRHWVLNRFFSKNGNFQFDQYTRVQKTIYSFFSRKINNFRVLQYFIKVFLNLKVCILIKAVTILIRIDRIADPDRIEIGSIIREILPDPTIFGYLNTGEALYNESLYNEFSL